jgi:hypothetical protein
MASDKSAVQFNRHYAHVENMSENIDDYIDIESNTPYENDPLNVQRTPSHSSTSTCSPNMQAHRSMNCPYSPTSSSHDHRPIKRIRTSSSSAVNDNDETSKRFCLPSNIRPTVKNDLRNIESLIERAPDKANNVNESLLNSTNIDPNYLYLFYMAQFHQHQKLPTLPSHALNRYLYYNQQHFPSYPNYTMR